MSRPKHPFKKGQKVTCVRAPEKGIPITEGEKYTVKSTFFGNQYHVDECIPGMEDTPGITVNEADGWFTADRFQ